MNNDINGGVIHIKQAVTHVSSTVQLVLKPVMLLVVVVNIQL